MDVKLRTEYTSSSNPIEFILRSRGVPKEHVTKYLFPDKSLEPSYENLDNLEEGIELLKKHLQQNSKIMIQVDADFDGYTSASEMYQFITKDMGHEADKVCYHVPHKKTHGINVEETLKREPDLLIVPDAGSSDFEEHKILKEKGIDILVIDHHEVDGECYSEDALVINNQLSDGFVWKGLTGSAMVYLFIKAYVETHELDIDHTYYMDLCAMGLVADRAPLTDTGVFYYVNFGLRTTQNELVNYIIAKSQNLETGQALTPKDVGFSISPLFNAMTREGKAEEIELVIDAFFGKEYTVYNKRLKKECTAIEEAYRKMNNTRNRQSKKVKEAMEIAVDRIKERGVDEHKVILVNSTSFVEESGINGLMAGKLADKYQKPALIMQYHEEADVLQGSGRNSKESPIEDLRGALEDTGVFNYVSGHAGAFGFEISREEAAGLLDVVNEKFADVEYDNVQHLVDMSYYMRPDSKDVIEIANNQHLWGEKLEAPLVHIHGIRVMKGELNFIGTKGNTWKLDLGASEGIMFNLTEEQMLTLTNHPTAEIEIEIVGDCSINTFRGAKKPQIVIKDFDVKPVESDQENPWANIEVDDLPF